MGFAASLCNQSGDKYSWVSIPASACAVCTQCARSAHAVRTQCKDLALYILLSQQRSHSGAFNVPALKQVNYKRLVMSQRISAAVLLGKMNSIPSVFQGLTHLLGAHLAQCARSATILGVWLY